MPLQSPLTDMELESIDAFPADPVGKDTAMDVATLECFLVALTIGPETVMSACQHIRWITAHTTCLIHPTSKRGTAGVSAMAI